MKKKFISIKKLSIYFILLVYTLNIIKVSANEKLNVLTSTLTIKSIVESLAGDKIHLDSIINGPRDPHYISPKPSYMLKAKKADLFIFVGMDLEVGWLSGIIKGSRNPKVQKNQMGYLDLSQFIEPLSVPKGKVDRFFGDIHPFGNPHYLLDPIRAIQVAQGIVQRLMKLDPKNKSYYLEKVKEFKKNIKEKTTLWNERIKKTAVKNIVTYHSSFEYFLDRFQLKLAGLIEEKPGIPPSAKHVLSLIKQMRENKYSCVLMSSFYENNKINKIKKTIPVHIETVAIEVGALKSVTNYIMLIEDIVKAIESCGKFKQTGN